MTLYADKSSHHAAEPRPDGLACRTGSVASPVLRALWFIESHLTADLRLQDIAQASGLSRFQLSRTFVAVTGFPVMQYLRSRRLTEAARVLAAGAPDILAVALDWGYGSHEAFTRAFCSHFGLTPERLRARRHLDELTLTEGLIMSEAKIVELAPPREMPGRARLIAGLGERYTFETNQGIPGLWQRFVPRMPQIPHPVGTGTYGVCCNSDSEGNFDYIAGVEVSSIDNLPRDFMHVALEPRRYAVFTHCGHISTIRDTVYSIWNHYLPRSNYKVVGAPDFERYTDAFDPHTGNGEVEIWIPIE
jgi:AraC family transcriptional regulator